MNNENRWNFFYDEAFHDRKIDVTKDNIINIYSKNASDIYVGAFIGCKEENVQELYKEFDKFENKFRKKFDLKEDQELKGTIIKKKNFQYGISSFNKNTIEYYENYFLILDDIKLIFNIVMLSKTTFYILKAFENINDNGCIYYKNVFLYSLIKFLYNHRYMKLLLKLFDENKLQSSKEIIDLLKSFIDEVIIKIQDIRKKASELNAIKQMRDILKIITVNDISNTEYLWNYNDVFDGFNLLLDQRGIKQNQVDLVIDREHKTYEAAINMGKYNSVKEADSKEVVGVRIVDILSNFIGRMILALDEDLREEEIKNIDDLININYTSKKLLDPMWFKLDKSKFNLYIKLYDIFINMIKQYNWTTYGSLYFDYSTLLFALIQYVASYKSFEEFSKLSGETHSENFNTYSCNMLLMRFQELY